MATKTPGENHRWYTEGAKSNPSDTTDLATTSDVGKAGDYLAECVVSADAACVINIQLVLDGAVEKTQRLYYSGASRDKFSIPFRADSSSHLLRIRPNASVTGNVSASIFLQKLT